MTKSPDDPRPMTDKEARELLQDGVVSAKEAAHLLGVTQSKFYMMLKEGDIITLRIGRRRMVPRGAITTYLTQQLLAENKRRKKGES